MRFSPFVERIGASDSGAGPEAWALHYQALQDRAAGRDVIVMSVGDPDFDTPPAVVEAAVEAMRAGRTHYEPVAGVAPLREAIATRFRARTGLETTAENVMVAPGAQCALFCSAICVAGPGDEILAPEPMYVTYEATVRAGGADLVRAPQPAEGGFRPDLDALAARITPATRALLFATPNNPTGVMLAAEEIAGIAELARAHDLWVISDEVYAETGFDRPHLSIAAEPGMAERTITISSLSKSHAMTGWRIGWAIGPTEAIGHFQNLALCMLYGLPGFTQAGGVAALTSAWEAGAEMRDGYLRRRDLFLSGVAGIDGIACAIPEGGMFALLDVRGTGLSGPRFCATLYEATGVSLLAADAFGPSAAGFARVSFALSEAQIIEAAARIRRFAEGLR